MLNTPDTLVRQYQALTGEFNLSGREAASRALVSNTISVIQSALLKPLSYLHENTFKAAPTITAAFTRVSGRNTYTRFVEKGPQYYALSKSNIAVPENMTGKLTDYTELLETLFVTTSDAIPKMMSEFRERIGILHHDQKELSKVITDFDKNFVDTKGMISKLKKEMSTTVSYAKQPYGKVLTKNKDWLPVADNLEVLFKQASKLDVTQVSKDANSLAEMVDIFIDDRLSNNSEVSAATISNLGKAVYELAEAIRFYGLLYSLVLELADLDKEWQARLGELC